MSESVDYSGHDCLNYDMKRRIETNMKARIWNPETAWTRIVVRHEIEVQLPHSRIAIYLYNAWSNFGDSSTALEK